MRNHLTLLMFVLPTVVGGTTFAADKDSGSSATLYGSISQGVVVTDRNKEEKTRADYLSDHVRVGIKGEEALGNGLQAFFNIHMTHKEKKESSGLNGLRAGKVIRYDLNNIGGSGFKFAVDGILDGTHEVIKGGKTRAFNAYDAAIGYKGHGLDTSLGYQRTSVDAIETELGGKTNEIIGASIAYMPFENKDKKQSLELAFDYQHHASFGDFFATSADYSFGSQKLRAGWEMLDYDKQRNWQQFHLGHRYYFSKRTFAEVKGAYRTQGDEHSYLTKILLRHEF